MIDGKRHAVPTQEMIRRALRAAVLRADTESRKHEALREDYAYCCRGERPIHPNLLPAFKYRRRSWIGRPGRGRGAASSVAPWAFNWTACPRASPALPQKSNL
jgi:hypothetical protein